MELFAILWILYTGVVVLAVYGFFLADTTAESMNGNFSRFLFEDLPRSFTSTCQSYLPRPVFEGCFFAYDYVVNKRNPILQITYILILNGSYTIWLLYGRPTLDTNAYLSWHHVYIADAGVLMCLYTFYLACKTDPGTITQETYPCFMHSPYDGTLFVKGKACTTCHVPKPARSKHCSLCGKCVAISDHHCIWINQCVGELNYRYFLLFLLTNTLFFTYAAMVLGLVLVSKGEGLVGAVFTKASTLTEYKGTPLIVAQYICSTNVLLVTICALAVIMAIAVGCFFIYHINLVSQGMTTNESVKLDRMQRLHARLLSEYNEKNANRGDGMVHSSCDECEMMVNVKHSKNDDDDRGGDNDSDPMTGCLPPSSTTSSPSGMILDNSRNDDKNDGRSFVRSVLDQLNDSGHWEMLKLHHPGPPPMNAYNRGFLANLTTTLYPLATRTENAAKWGTGAKIKKID